MFARVEYIFACNVIQDDGPLENFLKLSNIVDCSTNLVDVLFPFLDFLTPGKCEAMATECPFKVFNYSLGKTVEVANSEWGQVCRVWASEGIKPIDPTGNWIGILVAWPIKLIKHHGKY